MASSNLQPASASILAYTGSTLFVALFISELVHAPAPISPLLGLACHLVLLPVVATLPAPAWARAAGYVWLLIDLVLNVAAWNMASIGIGVSDLRLITATFDSMRQGIHVSAGLWIAAASWEANSGARATGTLAAAFLIVFALGGPWLADLGDLPRIRLTGRLVGSGRPTPGRDRYGSRLPTRCLIGFNRVPVRTSREARFTRSGRFSVFSPIESDCDRPPGKLNLLDSKA